MDRITPYLKSIAALVGAVATALLGIYGPETEMGRILTVAAAVATAVVTWAVPNKDPLGTHQRESVQPPGERGESSATVALVFLGLVLVLLIFLELIGAINLFR